MVGGQPSKWSEVMAAAFEELLTAELLLHPGLPHLAGACMPQCSGLLPRKWPWHLRYPAPCEGQSALQRVRGAGVAAGCRRPY